MFGRAFSSQTPSANKNVVLNLPYLLTARAELFIACEQALLFGRAKRASRGRVLARTRSKGGVATPSTLPLHPPLFFRVLHIMITRYNLASGSRVFPLPLKTGTSAHTL